jgi:hypothetical protein
MSTFIYLLEKHVAGFTDCQLDSASHTAGRGQLVGQSAVPGGTPAQGSSSCGACLHRLAGWLDWLAGLAGWASLAHSPWHTSAEGQDHTHSMTAIERLACSPFQMLLALQAATRVSVGAQSIAGCSKAGSNKHSTWRGTREHTEHTGMSGTHAPACWLGATAGREPR